MTLHKAKFAYSQLWSIIWDRQFTKDSALLESVQLYVVRMATNAGMLIRNPLTPNST